MRTDKPIKEIAFGARRITYNLHRRDHKRMRIVVSPELTVDVFAPVDAGEKQIEAALMKKSAWIKYHNHSKSFYSLLTRCQPDSRNRKELLDKFVLI